jgi:hypothetical protein
VIGAIIITYVMITASTDASQTTALGIAGVVGVLLPFILKYVPASGGWMVGITLAISLLVAVVAEIVTGEIVLSDLQHTDAGHLFAVFMSVWGLSQVVYASLTQHPATANAVN